MSKESAAAKVALSAVSQASYDSGPIRHFLAWAVAAHPARASEMTELIKGYIVEQEAAMLAFPVLSAAEVPDGK
jgi:hypothetical protein